MCANPALGLSALATAAMVERGRLMKGTTGVCRWSAALCVLVASVAPVCIADVALPPEPASLWTLVGNCPAVAMVPNPAPCLRVRLNGPIGVPSNATRLRMNLPGNVSVVATNTNGWQTDGPATAWDGWVPDDPLSDISITAIGDALVASIVTSDAGSFRVRGSRTDGSVVERTDFVAMPTAERPAIVPIRKHSHPASAPCASDPGTRIDVLVVYTPAAVVEASSENHLRSEILSAFRTTNASFRASGITQRISLRDVRLIKYRESGEPSKDLRRLRGVYDWHLRDAHRWRDETGADIVAMVTGDTKGKSFQFQSNHLENGDFAPWAFAILPARYLSAPYHVLAHELGHLMGSAHDFSTKACIEGAFPYSQGHLEPNASLCKPWMTIMSQPSYCTNCILVPYWSTSDPNKTLCGRPLGTAEGEDSARTLNQTALTVANFRCAKEL